MRFSLLLISTLATLTYFTSAIPVNGQDLAQPEMARAPMYKRSDDEWEHDDYEDHEWEDHEWEGHEWEEDCEEEDDWEHKKVEPKKVEPKEKTIYFFHTVTTTTTITKGHDHDEKHDRNHDKDNDRDRDGWGNGDRREWDHGFDLGHLFDHHRELNVPTGASMVMAAPTAAPVSV